MAIFRYSVYNGISTKYIQYLHSRGLRTLPSVRKLQSAHRSVWETWYELHSTSTVCTKSIYTTSTKISTDPKKQWAADRMIMGSQLSRIAPQPKNCNIIDNRSATRCMCLLLPCPDRVVLVEDGTLPRILVLLRLRPADDLVSSPHAAI